jgi:hypothetical protein
LRWSTGDTQPDADLDVDLHANPLADRAGYGE